MTAADDSTRLGRKLRRLSANADTPLDQSDELTGLLSRVAETEGIPEHLALALCRVLEHLYEADREAANPPLPGD